MTLNKFQRYRRLSIFMTGLQNQTRDFRAAVEADNLEKYLIGITIGVVLLSFIPSMGSAGEGNGEGDRQIQKIECRQLVHGLVLDFIA
jgi:hypothetical protein